MACTLKSTNTLAPPETGGATSLLRNFVVLDGKRYAIIPVEKPVMDAPAPDRCMEARVRAMFGDRLGAAEPISKQRALSALMFAAQEGFVDMGIWLAGTTKLTLEDVSMKSHLLLRTAVDAGHLDFCRWFVRKFVGITADDVRVLDNYMLHAAIGTGDIKMAEWLVETFMLTSEDASSDECRGFCTAARNGYLKTCQWAATVFGLTAKDVMVCSSHKALRSALANSNHDVVKWILDMYYTD